MKTVVQNLDSFIKNTTKGEFSQNNSTQKVGQKPVELSYNMSNSLNIKHNL